VCAADISVNRAIGAEVDNAVLAKSHSGHHHATEAGLGTHVIIPPAATADESEDLFKGWRDLLRAGGLQELMARVAELKILVGLAAIGLYGIVRVGYEAFYGSLGTTPEEVGITEFTAVGRAAIGLIVLTSIATVFIAALSTVVALPLLAFFFVADKLPRGLSVRKRVVVDERRASSGANRPQGAGRFSRYVAGIGCLGYGILNLWPAIVAVFSATSQEFDGLFAGIGLISTAVGLALLVGGYGPVRLLAIAVAMSGLFVASAGYGEDLAGNVKAGDYVHPGALSTLFAIQADPVCVAWIGADRPAGVDWSTSMVLLGRSDGELVLYHARSLFPTTTRNTAGVVRIPAAKVVIGPVDRAHYRFPIHCDPSFGS
jgi:hypothetical protein